MTFPLTFKTWFKLDITPEWLLTSYASTGDNSYLLKLVEHFNLPIYHYLLTQSDHHLAEDVLQTVWLKVIDTQAKLKKHSNVKSWLFTIARNTLIDELRRQQRWQWQTFDDQVLYYEDKSNEPQKDRLAAFNDALLTLNFHQREAIIFQQEGFSVEEISHLTGDNFETIKSRLRYARQNLKNLIGQKNERR